MSGAKPESAQQELRERQVHAALSRVRDPELDTSVTELGFVTEVVVDGDRVLIRLRLPTYFCAPNFAYLMVADAHTAVSELDWSAAVTVRLEDHFAADEINAGVAADAGFTGSFPDQAESELEELRTTFRRKAHTACLERACRSLLAAGWQVEGLAEARLADLPAGPQQEALLRRREELGLSCAPDAALMLDADGRNIPAGSLTRHLRHAQAVRVSIDGNGILCRGLLATRYGEDSQPRRAS